MPGHSSYFDGLAVTIVEWSVLLFTRALGCKIGFINDHFRNNLIGSRHNHLIMPALYSSAIAIHNLTSYNSPESIFSSCEPIREIREKFYSKGKQPIIRYVVGIPQTLAPVS